VRRGFVEDGRGGLGSEPQAGEAEGRERQWPEVRVAGEAGGEQGQVADEAQHQDPPDAAGARPAPAGVVDEDGRSRRARVGVFGSFHPVGLPLNGRALVRVE
jgi:hypothetical protein